MYDLTRFLRPVVDGLAGVLTPAQQTSTLPPELTMRRCSFDFDFENLPRLLRSGSLVGVHLHHFPPQSAIMKQRVFCN